MIIGIQAWDALTRWSTSVFKSIFFLLISGYPAREKNCGDCGLLTKAVRHSTVMSTNTPSSRASLLPQVQT
jgi:hypothetical protein